MNGVGVSMVFLARRHARLRVVALSGLIALVATACFAEEPDAPTTATPATSTTTSTATPTEDPEEALTPEESEWLGIASTVGPVFVSEALDAIASDWDDERAFLAATEAGGGPIETVVPEEAPGRFADPHAALLAAREELVAFRAEGLSRRETGTQYDALLAAYEQGIIEWAAIVGIEVH